MENRIIYCHFENGQPSEILIEVDGEIKHYRYSFAMLERLLDKYPNDNFYTLGLWPRLLGHMRVKIARQKETFKTLGCPSANPNIRFRFIKRYVE